MSEPHMTAIYYGCQPIDSTPIVYGARPWYKPSPANKPLIPPGAVTTTIDVGSPLLPDPELTALSRCINELSKLDETARKRVVKYLVERFS